MVDLKDKLFRDVRNAISVKLNADDASYVLDVLLVKLNEYELTERCTAIAVIDDTDEIILKNYAGCNLIEGKSKKSVFQYDRAIRKLMEYSRKDIRHIETKDIRVWLASMKLRGCKNTTIGNHRCYVNTFFKWLVNEGIIEKNPCDPINPVKKPNSQKKSLSDEDIDALRSACEIPIERAMIEFLLSSGVRVQECADMLVNDVDLERMIVTVRHGKGDKERQTYISPVAKKHLLIYLNSRVRSSPYLFVSLHNDGYSTRGIAALIKRVAKRANVSNVHPHRFRRTLATTLAKRGMQIQEIQKILGHTNIVTTQGYIDTEMADVEASYRKYVA